METKDLESPFAWCLVSVSEWREQKNANGAKEILHVSLWIPWHGEEKAEFQGGGSEPHQTPSIGEGANHIKLRSLGRGRTTLNALIERDSNHQRL